MGARGEKGCGHPNDIGIEEELAIAERARGVGDWKHALHHYVNALGLEPSSAQAVAGLRHLAASSPVEETIAESGYVGAHVARAYLHWDRGEADDAIEILSQVDAALPDLGVVALLLEWFDGDGASERARAAVLWRFGTVVSLGLGRLRLLPGERAAAEPYAELAARLAIHSTDGAALAVLSGLLRRAGRHEEALVLADKSCALGEQNGSVARALVLRAMGRPAEAVTIFRGLFEETNDSMYLIESARALGDAARYEEARRAMGEVIASTGLEPALEESIFHLWVTGCSEGDPSSLARDYDWVRRSATGAIAILGMSDAGTNLIADPAVPKGRSFRVAVSTLEAPSVRLCLALFQGSGADPGAVRYEFAGVQSPDPRVPRGQVQTLLWIEREGVMVQAVEPPSAEVANAVAEVAAEASDLQACWNAAGERVAKFTDRLPEIVATMVHPPPLPAGGVTWVHWLYRCQVGAACLVARSSERWAGSERRRVLLELLRGPTDWTTSAVVLALGEIAVREPSALPEIRRELTELSKVIPEDGYCCFAPTLALTMRKVPMVRPEIVDALASWLEPHAEDASAEAPSGEVPSEEASTRPSSASPMESSEDAPAPKRPWWKFW